MQRNAQAHWKGDLKSGAGTLSAPSGVLANTPYSFKTRFELGVTGTNPEELLAAGPRRLLLYGALTDASKRRSQSRID